jgi:hypothetical protein
MDGDGIEKQFFADLAGNQFALNGDMEYELRLGDWETRRQGDFQIRFPE